MKLFMAGKWKLGFGKSDNHHIPPPPNNPPPEPPTNGVNVRQQVSRINAFSSNYPQRNDMHSAENSHPSPVSHNSHMLGNRTSYGETVDETSSTSSEKYERDVTILNCCFDDIERFIGRLQSAAAAFRELERRRRTRKGKKKDHGEGMLSMRAKPPPEREFVDILQKFKLSFNLLAKLKSHIHDPNAPELVHFLFTPLALIMDASRDSNYGPNLASKVVSPLLTREAVDLLTNCLTSKESDLWHSLGDAWIIPREQWKDYVSPYHPVFSNGWAPDYPFSEDRERAEITAVAAASAAQRARREEILKAQHDAEIREQEYHQRGPILHNENRFGGSYYYTNDRVDRPSPSPSMEDRRQHFDSSFDGHHLEETRGFNEREHTRSPHSDRDYPEHRDRDGRSDISADSIERSPLDPHRQFDRHQRNWLEELKARGSKIVQVTYPRTANNDKELTVFRGEYLEVLDDSRKWWKTRNARGQIAHVPHTIVTPYQPGDEDAIFNNPLYTRSSRESIYGQDSPNRSTDGSFIGERPPFRLPSAATPTPAPAERIKKERQGKKGNEHETGIEKIKEEVVHNSIENKKIDPLPPPMVPPLPPPSRIDKARQDQARVTEEIKLRFQNQKILFPRPKAPSAYITGDSTAAEVADWLRVKEFSPSIIKALHGMDGDAMFHLVRSDVEEFCGKEEATRLISQLNIQKSVCGYKTARTKELGVKLARQRQRASFTQHDYSPGYDQYNNIQNEDAIDSVTDENSDDLSENAFSQDHSDVFQPDNLTRNM